MKRITVLFLIASLCINLAYAQKRTTSVKGYYRKNGTYVSPHTRGYSAGSSSSSTSVLTSSTSIYSDTEENSSSESIIPSILKLIKINQGNGKKSRSWVYNQVQGQKVTETKLNFVEADSTARRVSNEQPDSGVVFYVSVLRYNGKTIDVCPISRDILSGWSFNSVSHQFKKEKISTEDALDLVANYEWEIIGKEMSRKFYSYYSKKLPKYLTKTIEAIKVE